MLIWKVKRNQHCSSQQCCNISVQFCYLAVPIPYLWSRSSHDHFTVVNAGVITVSLLLRRGCRIEIRLNWVWIHLNSRLQPVNEGFETHFGWYHVSVCLNKMHPMLYNILRVCVLTSASLCKKKVHEIAVIRRFTDYFLLIDFIHQDHANLRFSMCSTVGRKEEQPIWCSFLVVQRSM